MEYAIGGVLGLLVGGLAAFIIASARMRSKVEQAERAANVADGKVSGLESNLEEFRRQAEKSAGDLSELRDKLSAETGARIKAETQLAETVQRFEEERKLLDDAKTKFIDAFKALAGDTLKSSNEEFLKLAKETFDKTLEGAKGDLGKRQEAIKGLVKPLEESLKKFEGLSEQIKQVGAGQMQLQKETANLVTALRRPEVRGKWGENTLRRVVEISGMSSLCDFVEQVTAHTDNGVLRPDLIVKLPAEREIVVDAKVALDAYLDATTAESAETRAEAMSRHVKHVRTHVSQLAGKKYWEQFPKAPEFVVMFISVEASFGAALEMDPNLIEYGLEQRVLITTPTTLVALLRAVAYGWRQEQVIENIEEIRDLGRDLYDRMRVLAEHIGSIGKGIEKASEAYNDAVGSMERRVLPAARKFKDLGVRAKSDIPQIESVGATPRILHAPELAGEG